MSLDVPGDSPPSRPAQAATATATQTAQGCEQVPPSCQRAQDRGQQVLSEFPRTSGITDSASAAYCAFVLGEEVMNYCAQEFRRAGRANCAGPVEQQAAEYRRSQAQAQGTIDATSASGLRQKCTWQR
jgi:hypothetical protein